MENNELRQALRLWVQSDQIERHQFSVIPETLKTMFAWFCTGATFGFIFGFVMGILKRG